MVLFGAIILFFLIITVSYFVLDIAVKNENEGMKVFGAILFSFLLVIAFATLFGGIFAAINGIELNLHF